MQTRRSINYHCPKFLLSWSCLMELPLVWWIKCYWMELNWKFVPSCWLPCFQQCIPILFFSTAILGPVFLYGTCVFPHHISLHLITLHPFIHVDSVVSCLPPYRCMSHWSEKYLMWSLFVSVSVTVCVCMCECVCKCVSECVRVCEVDEVNKLSDVLYSLG